MRHAAGRGLAFALLGLVVVASGELSASGVRAQADGPSLRLINPSRQNFPIVAQGWPHRGIVGLAVTGAFGTTGLVLRANRQGQFRVRVHIFTCGLLSFTAQNLRGHAVTAAGPVLPCPLILHPVAPLLTIVKGKRVKPKVVTIEGRPPSVTVNLGELLAISEPATIQSAGMPRPSTVPHGNSSHLLLISQRVPASGTCTQPNCQVSMTWEWLAVRTGKTGIDLSPACRQSVPPCEMPDYLIRVIIEPRAQR